MPTSVRDCFASAGLSPQDTVRWGTRPPKSSAGVYVVALTDSEAVVAGTLSAAPLADDAFEAWLKVVPGLIMDGVRPTVDSLKERIQGFWMTDETILYIGLATSLSSRLGAYYRTPIGARRPHAGGYFLKLLANLDTLWVHYSLCPDPAQAEDAMIGRFCEGVSERTLETIRDPAHPFPFANLEWPPGTRKAHGLRGAREPRVSHANTSPRPEGTEILLPPGGAAGSCRTQRVTKSDLGSGQIRIPSSGAAPTKSLFPAEKGYVHITVRGRRVRALWDPRMGPDRERSGVLRIGTDLRELVHEDETLAVTTDAYSLTID